MNYLCISATFLANQFHGRDEWPPSPARLFQALLAGSETCRYRLTSSEDQTTLRALESIPRAPEILACKTSQLHPYCISVPNNDLDLAARAWLQGTEFDTGNTRKVKRITPRKLLGASGYPHVQYIWHAPDSICIDSVRRLAHYLHTFGWGVDMAYADAQLINDEEKRRLTSQDGYEHFVPASTGRILKVPVSGYLDDLKRAYRDYCTRISKSGVNPDTRATLYGQQRYRRVGALVPAYARFAMRALGSSAAPYSVPWALGMQVAAWMRGAAHEALKGEYQQEFIDSYVLGHGEEGRKSHVSFVPVPSIRTMHGDGAIRRVMILEPIEGPPAHFGVQRGDVTELLQWKLSPATLSKLVETGGNGRVTKPVCSLVEAQDDGVWNWYFPRQPKTLWHSVTPVILHGFNARGRRFSPKRTEELLLQAFEESGFPRHMIVSMAFQPAPFWPGTEGALAARVPEYLSKWPRCHVAVRFREPLWGPVLVGIGRHYGLGLFAAPRE